MSSWVERWLGPCVRRAAPCTHHALLLLAVVHWPSTDAHLCGGARQPHPPQPRQGRGGAGAGQLQPARAVLHLCGAAAAVLLRPRVRLCLFRRPLRLQGPWLHSGKAARRVGGGCRPAGHLLLAAQAQLLHSWQPAGLIPALAQVCGDGAGLAPARPILSAGGAVHRIRDDPPAVRAAAAACSVYTCRPAAAATCSRVRPRLPCSAAHSGRCPAGERWRAMPGRAAQAACCRRWRRCQVCAQL